MRGLHYYNYLQDRELLLENIKVNKLNYGVAKLMRKDILYLDMQKKGLAVWLPLAVALAVLLILPSLAGAELPFPTPSNPQQLPTSALIQTTKGAIEIEFYREEAPITVASFAYLAKKGFYKNLKFHRYVPNFVIQGGDPQGTGQGGPGYTLPPEHSSNLRHLPGTLGMARLPGEVNPERRSNGSQFYITLVKAKHLDGLYTIFARVVAGMDAVKQLRPGDMILDVRVSKE